MIFLKIVEIIKTNQDLSRNLNIMETFWIWKWWKISTNWEISVRNMQKSTYFSIEIETNCRGMTKFPGFDKLLDLDRDFWVWILMSRWNREILISIKISWLSRQTFLKMSRFSWLLRQTVWQCRDRDSQLRPRWDKSRPPSLGLSKSDPIMQGLL